MPTARTLNTISRIMQAAAILALGIVAVYALLMLLFGRTIPHKAPVLYPLAFHKTLHYDLAALLFLLLLGLVIGVFVVMLIAGVRHVEGFNPQPGRRALQIGAAATLLMILAAFIRTVQIGADVDWQEIAQLQDTAGDYRLLDYTTTDPAQPADDLLRLFHCDRATGLLCAQVYICPVEGALPTFNNNENPARLVSNQTGQIMFFIGETEVFAFVPDSDSGSGE